MRRFVPLFVGVAFFASTVAYAGQPIKQHLPHSNVHLSLSVQVLEIISMTPTARHITALVTPGLSLAWGLSPTWTLVSGVSFATGVDAISAGLSFVIAAEANLWRRGPWRLGIGPDFVFIQSASKREENWSWTSIFSLGLGTSVGYKGTTLGVGLAASMSPQFGPSVSLTPRIGLSTSFF